MLSEKDLDEIRQRDDIDALLQHIEEQDARITQLERQFEDAQDAASPEHSPSLDELAAAQGVTPLDDMSKVVGKLPDIEVSYD